MSANPHTIAPILRAALGYAHLVADIPMPELMAGFDDNWHGMQTAALSGPSDRIQLVHSAAELCVWSRKYNDPAEFERALSGLLRAADLMPDVPKGKEWRRASESEAWQLRSGYGRVRETPSIWSAYEVGATIIVPAIVGVTFREARDAIDAAATVRRRCLEGHGDPVGLAFADSLDALTAQASVEAP
jgi:hypothetical protein